MKPQEIKFTFVYNEIKQCRKHFTGISDFCSNIAFTYVFSLQGPCGKIVWNCLLGPAPNPVLRGLMLRKEFFAVLGGLVRLEYGPGLGVFDNGGFQLRVGAHGRLGGL